MDNNREHATTSIGSLTKSKNDDMKPSVRVDGFWGDLIFRTKDGVEKYVHFINFYDPRDGSPDYVLKNVVARLEDRPVENKNRTRETGSVEEML